LVENPRRVLEIDSDDEMLDAIERELRLLAGPDLRDAARLTRAAT
jgi:hypothetical protein